MCPSCGKMLPPDAPLGLCPQCLIQSGFNTATDPGSQSMQSGFEPPSLEELSKLFPHLEILEFLGRGGMGAVYKARQPRLDRFVALKILRPAVSGSGFAERFNREARALARLNHPRIVTVHDFGVAGDLHYLVMEYVDGPNLRQTERSGRLTPEQALRIVPQICEALQFAHDQGIVHRDIKPENILLDKDGRIKITDFGIAKLVGVNADRSSLTGARDVVGTPHYMAPEQIENPSDVDHRADIYSLGVVFYEMLTGELPLGRFAPPSKRVEVDVRLDEVVLRSLEKERDRRYQQAAQIKTHVETISGSPQPSIVQTPPYREPITYIYIPALALYGAQALMLVPAELAIFREDLNAAFGWIVLNLMVLMVSYITWGVLHYECWKALPERYRATTPGRAAGFLFIPLFNFVWVFISMTKLAKGFNAWRADFPELPVRNMSALAVTKAITFVCYWTLAWIPGLVSAVALADLLVFALYYRGIVFNANLMIRPRKAITT